MSRRIFDLVILRQFWMVNTELLYANQSRFNPKVLMVDERATHAAPLETHILYCNLNR